MKKRVREISDREKYENLIDAYVQSGYKITRDDGDYCKLRKSSYGGWGWNIVIFFLTVWWTFFLGNLAYMLISNQLNSRLVELYYKPELEWFCDHLFFLSGNITRLYLWKIKNEVGEKCKITNVEKT